MILSFNFSFTTMCRAILLLAVVVVAGCSSPEEKAQSYYEQGMQFLSKKDYVKAGIEFKNALQIKKNMVGAWRGLLKVEVHNRNVKDMVPILRTIVELDPKDIVSKLELGHLLLVGNALDKALDLANAAIALDASNPKALAFRAAVLLKLKDSAGAKRDAQAAVDIDPSNAEALIVLAAERATSGDTEGALLILNRKGLHIKPEDEFAIQLFKLQLYEKSGDLKQQEALLRKLIDLYPFESALQGSLINLYVKQKRYDDAERELRALAYAHPSNFEIGMNLVRFLQQVKGPAAAREELLARIKAGANVFKYQIALAEFDFSQGRADDSVQLLEKLISGARSSDDAVVAQAKLAQIQFSRRNFDAAQALVTEILRKDDRNIDGLKLRAQIRMQKGQLDAAIADLRQALNDRPRSSELMLLLGQAYERSGSIELAEKQYADATKVSGFRPGPGLNYAAFLRRRGSLDRAEDILTELTRRWPNNYLVLSALAEVRLARQNWSGAEEIAEAIRHIGKTQGLSDQILAAALSGQGKYGDSVKILESMQAAAPAAVQPMVALVNTLVRAKKLDQAVNFLQTVLKKTPTNTEARVLLGSVQLLKNAPDQAVQSFRTAIEQQPKEMAGYMALAQFYIRNKKLDEAEKTARAGLKEKPNNFAIQMTLAGILELKDDYEAAIAVYEGLLKQQPGSMIVANNLASLLSDHRTDKASIERAYSVAAMLRKSQVPSFKDTLGWVYYLRGDYKSATSLLEEASAALPTRAMVQYHLGMSYVATGQIGKASKQFKKALALGPDNSLRQKIAAAQKKTENITQ
jgi:tetratricopeptide (TPR) repeat protein